MGLQLATQMLVMLTMLATRGCGAPDGHADAHDAHDACHVGLWGLPPVQPAMQMLMMLMLLATWGCGVPAGHADAHDACHS